MNRVPSRWARCRTPVRSSARTVAPAFTSIAMIRPSGASKDRVYFDLVFRGARSKELAIRALLQFMAVVWSSGRDDRGHLDAIIVVVWTEGSGSRRLVPVIRLPGEPFAPAP